LSLVQNNGRKGKMKYKLKTKRAAAKRFKITKTGKVLRYKSGRRHLLEHEDPGTKRLRRNMVEVSSSDMKKVKQMLPGL